MPIAYLPSGKLYPSHMQQCVINECRDLLPKIEQAQRAAEKVTSLHLLVEDWDNVDAHFDKVHENLDALVEFLSSKQSIAAAVPQYDLARTRVEQEHLDWRHHKKHRMATASQTTQSKDENEEPTCAKTVSESDDDDGLLAMLAN